MSTINNSGEATKSFAKTVRLFGTIPETTSTISVNAVGAEEFEHPSQVCGIVMKGGVTSGIVYPPAIIRIAQQFRLKQVGGTSAGAIAAAVAAAAEFRRSRPGGTGQGFMQLKTDVLDWLGRGRNLQSLFVPQAVLAPWFYTLLWLVGLGSATRRFTLAGAANLIVTLVIALAIVYGFVCALFGLELPYSGVARLVALVATIVAILFVFGLLYLVPRNWHGLCSCGVAGTIRGLLHLRVEPLSFWMSRQIDSIAAMPARRPLTIGDLWKGDVRGKGDPIPSVEDRVIDLSMITTCLTMNRPFTLPFDKNIFYFKADEFSRYFPEYVVTWMVESQRPVIDSTDPNAEQRRAFLAQQGYVPFPLGQDMPVVVAARLSLSAPLLISAIRLYAIDWTQAQDPARPTIEPVWFSDGGLSSNFPISLFDKALPRWPTLGITLEEFPPGDNNAVVMPMRNGDGIGSVWTRFDQGKTSTNAPGFYGALINSLQNWQDIMQSEAPGFRDRIAHIRLGPREGGLNLTMPPDVIETLSARGESAGAQLVEHFKIPVPSGIVTNWRNHKFVRYRLGLAALEPYCKSFSAAWNEPNPGPNLSYESLVQNPPSYKLGFEPALSLIVTQRMVDIAGRTQGPNPSLTTGAPRPETVLTAHPRI